MAPGRKRGSKGGGKNSELSLGDLVLAKIKGFPAWPAKISRPEDWKHAPDPKKYFVQFFGTSEIAFIAPADIQAFTDEAKSKLSARCQGKTVKHFAKAVKEICDEFEALQQKNINGVRNNTMDSSSKYSADSMGDEASRGAKDDEISNEGAEKKLETKSSNGIDYVRLDGSKNQDVRACSSDDKDHSLPPHISSEKINELSSNPEKPVKKDSVMVSSSSPVKTEALHDRKVEAGSSNIRAKESTIRRKLKLGQGQKGKNEVIMDKNIASQEHSRHDILTKFAPGSNIAGFSMDGIVLGLAAVSRNDLKKLLNKKVRSDARANSRKDAKGKDEEHHNKVIPKKMKNPLHGRGDSKPFSPSKASKRINSITKETGHSYDEDGLPQAKRHCKQQDRIRTPSLQENKMGDLDAQKNGLVHPDKGQSPVIQLPKKRRLVRLYDDEDDELPKTPVHGGITNKASSIPRMSDSKKKTVVRGESHPQNQRFFRISGTVNDAFRKQAPPVRSNKALSIGQHGVEKRTHDPSTELASSRTDAESLPTKNAKLNKVSPKRSPRSTGGTSLELPSKISSNVPNIVPQKKVLEGANRESLIASDQSSSLLKQSMNEKSISTFSGEKKKTTPKTETRVRNASPRGSLDEEIVSSGVRLDDDKHSMKNITAESKNSEFDVSMKNLIAAAQERKRQASLQNSSPKPPFQSINTLQSDLQFTSPSFDIRQLSSSNQREIDDFEERRVSGSSLSSSTDAVVARDAFEGMIETLSRRNRESILRAARHAIDCAKYGIANEIVDLLVRKLENEPNLHRKVDIFFLVDSITKQSHSKKGIAGASYIPCVEAALPRLIAAVAPPGPDAQENRRQCNKVLRLWLERKILPERVIRRQMNDIAAANDDDTNLLPPRRPSRAERSFDDPVLAMEGMLVDEYGSNATFQLSRLMASHMFDDEEDGEDTSNPPKTLINEVAHTSPSEQTPASRDTSNYTVTPNDRRHRILEDVDHELEMEDDSVHHNDKALDPNVFASVASNLESISKVSESLPSPERSPQLPLDTPPETPPLPSSPYPLCLPPAPSPPPLSSPALPLPPKPLPPPPPLPSSQHHSYTHLPPPPYLSQPQVPPQVAMISQQRPPLPISLPIPYPSPLPHEVRNMPNGTPLHATPIKAPMRGEGFSQKQASFHLPATVSTAHERVVYNTSKPVEYGQGDSYVNFQALQQRPPHLPVVAPFGQRPLSREPPPQRAPTHFSYLNAAPQHQHPPHTLPNFPNGPRRFVGDGQWHHLQGNEGWISGARSGYFGTTPQERPMSAAVDFHHSAANVHGVHMMPSRPDSSSHWRPV